MTIGKQHEALRMRLHDEEPEQGMEFVYLEELITQDGK